MALKSAGDICSGRSDCNGNAVVMVVSAGGSMRDHSVRTQSIAGSEAFVTPHWTLFCRSVKDWNIIGYRVGEVLKSTV